MIEFLRRLFESTDFMPHGHCYLWKPDILWLTVLGDAFTGIAYYTLPFMLFYIVKCRTDLAHRNVFILFGVFIMACGTTHFIDIWTVWFPTYRIASILTMLTGIVSLLSAYVLFKAIPNILSIPSNHMLEEANRKLKAEIFEKENAQRQLRQANDELEIRVQQRTAQLIKANRELEREIETRVKAERSLIGKNGELIRINQDLDNFVYCASHDLKTPVVNAEGLVTALREEIPTDKPMLQELTGRLEQSIRQMRFTIQDLSEITGIQKNADAEVEKISFAGVLQEVKVDLKDNIDQAAVVITEDWQAAPYLWFTHKNLKSILYNLVSNAIKYRAANRAAIIRIASREEGDFIVLSVQDNGIGIDLPKNEAKIFTLFKRLHHEDIDGTGVGLFIVKRIMDFNQGRVTVQSEPGSGSTFNIYFPKRETSQA